MSDAASMPAAGFQRVPRTSPFITGIGPIYVRPGDKGPSIGLRIEARHTNLGGKAHGGLLATLADNAMGYGISTSRQPHLSIVTVSLTTDFLDAAGPGDWLEARVEVLRIGKRLAYAACEVVSGERRILRASGVFALISPAGGPDLSDG